MMDMLSSALRARGTGEEHAAIAAGAGWGILAHAMGRWQADPAVPLGEQVELAFRQLRELLALPGEQSRRPAGGSVLEQCVARSRGAR